VKIQETKLPKFLKKLPLPIGFPEEMSARDLKKQLLQMGIRRENGFVYFNELLYKCMRRLYGKFKLNRKMAIYELHT
jgi:hypothetical protein